MGSRRRCGQPNREEVITNPTETIVNVRENNRVVRHIHPTEVINVNRTIVRNEHYYPVTEREVNETVEENVDVDTDDPAQGCRSNEIGGAGIGRSNRKKKHRPRRGFY